jgi:uncharacterized repeat protein (TIGR01451 family)
MIKNLKLLCLAALAVSVVSCGGGGRRSGGTVGTMPADPCQSPKECIECTDGIVRVIRCMPNEVTLGQDFNVILQATATAACTDVVIKEKMADGLIYVSSDPAAKVEGNALIWDLGDLKNGECRQLTVTYTASAEGCYTSCYTVEANPCCCQCVRVGCPDLAICKTGTQCVRLGCPVQYRIVVSNNGSMMARDVVLTDYVPDELRHKSCCKELTWCLGDLGPCESKTVDVCFDTVKCGRTINRATAVSCNCPPVTDTACTCIDYCCISLDKTGPCGPIVVGKDATYKITAKNNGNTDLTNVKIIDVVPSGARIKSAPGAEVQGNRATWIVDTFPAEGTKEFELTMTSCAHGCLTNCATVCCSEECADKACATTRWIGVAGIWMGMKSTRNPVCVGLETEFCIAVQNQGFADDHDVKIVVEFPAGLQPLSASAEVNYKIDGNKVVFDAIPTLHAGRTQSFRIRAMAKEVGEARVKASVRSELLKDSVTTEEAVNVY